jgi:hypothetical protein
MSLNPRFQASGDGTQVCETKKKLESEVAKLAETELNTRLASLPRQNPS